MIDGDERFFNRIKHRFDAANSRQQLWSELDGNK